MQQWQVSIFIATKRSQACDPRIVFCSKYRCALQGRMQKETHVCAGSDQRFDQGWGTYIWSGGSSTRPSKSQKKKSTTNTVVCTVSPSPVAAYKAQYQQIDPETQICDLAWGQKSLQRVQEAGCILVKDAPIHMRTRDVSQSSHLRQRSTDNTAMMKRRLTRRCMWNADGRGIGGVIHIVHRGDPLLRRASRVRREVATHKRPVKCGPLTYAVSTTTKTTKTTNHRVREEDFRTSHVIPAQFNCRWPSLTYKFGAQCGRSLPTYKFCAKCGHRFERDERMAEARQERMDGSQ